MYTNFLNSNLKSFEDMLALISVKIGALTQPWQQDPMQGRVVNLQRWSTTSRERKFIEQRRFLIFFETDFSNSDTVGTPPSYK